MSGRYFAAGIPCPFLEEERCGVYDERPVVCREYAVTSPPELCERLEPGLEAVERPVHMDQALRIHLRPFERARGLARVEGLIEQRGGRMQATGIGCRQGGRVSGRGGAPYCTGPIGGLSRGTPGPAVTGRPACDRRPPTTGRPRCGSSGRPCAGRAFRAVAGCV